MVNRSLEKIKCLNDSLDECMRKFYKKERNAHIISVVLASYLREFVIFHLDDNIDGVKKELKKLMETGLEKQFLCVRKDMKKLRKMKDEVNEG